MASITRREAANIAIYVLRSVTNDINIDSAYISYAAAAGVSVTTAIPTTDPISYLSLKNASASQMISMVQNYTTLCAKTLRINFTRTGYWVLTANPFSTNQGSAYYYQQAALPMPGTVSSYNGYISSSTPVQSQLTPPAPGYTIFATTKNILRQDFVNLTTNLKARVQAHMANNPVAVSYCHTSCHNNCHTSRGRR